MVHALKQAWRVLKPAGILLDLRALRSNRRIGLLIDGTEQPVATHTHHERAALDAASDAAIQTVLTDDYFTFDAASDFEMVRYFDTPSDLYHYPVSYKLENDLTDTQVAHLNAAKTDPAIKISFNSDMILRRYRRRKRVSGTKF